MSLRRAAILTLSLLASCGPRPLDRFPDRPALWQDDDRRDVAKPPAPYRPGRWATAVRSQVTGPLGRLLSASPTGRASNVNAFGEVPSSSWFENRNHRRRRSLAAIRRGAAKTSGPSLLAPWRVAWGAATGRGPELVIVDEQRRRFLLSFDAPGHPRLATTAELVATLLLHALGYHVPERHLVLFELTQLRVTGASRKRRPDGLERSADRPLTTKGLRALLARLPRLKDGSLRAVATRLDGSTDLGPFRYRGRRSDDPNDRLDHQRRRELRGLGPVAALLNLTGITLEIPRDRFLTRKPRHVRHYLWSLRGALGSTAQGLPKPLWEGWAPQLSPQRMLQQALTFGLVRSPWMTLGPLRRRLLTRWPGLGWLAGPAFVAREFSPRLGNAALAAADAGDRQWGARLVASLSHAQLRAAVKEALLPAAEAKRLVAVLWVRRAAVLRQWLARRAPLAGYQVIGGAPYRLCFDDLWRREGFGTQGLLTYETRLRADSGVVRGSLHRHLARFALVCVPLPPLHRVGSDDGYRVLELRRPDASAAWARVHLQLGTGRPVIRGIER